MAPAYASRRSPEGRLPSSGRVVLGRGSVTREIAAGSAVVVLDATTGDIRLSLSASRIDAPSASSKTLQERGCLPR